MDTKKRNIIILIVIIVLILLGFLINGYIASSKKQSVVATTQPSPTGTITKTNGSTKSSFIPPNPSLMPRQVVPAWKEGDTNFFSIQFPSTWSPNVSSVTGGGITAAFKPTPNTGTATQLFPRLEVEVSPENASAPIADRVKTLTPLHFQIEQVQFQGIPATMMSGSLPFTVANQNGVKKNVYKNFIFFSYNHNIYSIDYAYYEDTNAPTNQEIFSIMLAGFKLK